VSGYEAERGSEQKVVETVEPAVAAPSPLAFSAGAVVSRERAVARIRRFSGGSGMSAPMARATVRGLGNAQVGRLLSRSKFVKQPPTPEEKAMGEAAVRADQARSAPLVSAARAKYNAKASSLIGA
jgi:hypothetical protein